MAGPLGSTPGIIVGVGVGGAVAAALEPAVTATKQAAWFDNPHLALDPGIVARFVAQGGMPLGEAQAEAKLHGIASDKFDALVYLSQTVPGFAEALRLWRRGLIPDELWSHALVKAGLDARYMPALNEMKVSEPVDPAVVAVAIQRTVLDNPGILPNQPSTEGSNVPPMPQVPIDPVAEAAKSGVNEHVLAVLARIVGLPASPDLAARMHFREIITEGAFNQAILEGNTRGEWAPFLLEGFREILTAHDYAELELRGFLTRPARLAGTGKHGMSPADSDLLYDVLGRSIPVHQITTGLARGGTYRGPANAIPESYLTSLQRGNLRPEYYNLAYANRYSYPSAFVIRSLLSDAAITAAEGEQIFLDIGWRPDLAKKVATHYAPAAGPVADKHLTKAQGQLWTTLHRSYIAAESVDSDARERFALLGIPAAAQTAILDVWDSERALVRKQLSPVQVRKAFTGAVLNPATGAPWTEADALSALIARGYSDDDARTFLAEA